MSAAVSHEQLRSLSVLFYRAVRDLRPVWMLEDMRTLQALCPGEDPAQRTYSPSEALLYAIVHDHQAYAQYLLSHFPEEALQEPGERFCCCPDSAPHLALAVRYDRRTILGLILQEAHRVPSGTSAASGCLPKGDGQSPLHLACELVRPEAVLLLLGSGASPMIPDARGLTPLDVLLEQLRDCEEEASRGRRHCLDTLLMFMPRLRFHLWGALRREPHRWTGALGSDMVQVLVGAQPAPLLLTAMQTVLKQLSPTSFCDSLLQLPIPPSVRPVGLAPSPRSWGPQ